MNDIQHTLDTLSKLEDMGFEHGKVTTSSALHSDYGTDTGAQHNWSAVIMGDYDEASGGWGVDIIIDYSMRDDGTFVLHDGDEDMYIEGAWLCREKRAAIKEMIIEGYSVISVESLEQMENLMGDWVEFIGREL